MVQLAAGNYSMKKSEINALAEHIVTFGELTIDVRRLSPKARNDLFEAIVQVMIDKGLLIQGVGEDLHVSGETVQQIAALLQHQGEGEFRQ